MNFVRSAHQPTIAPDRRRAEASTGDAKRTQPEVSTTLPTPPVALSRIIAAAGDPEVSAQALGRLLEMDPALSASLMGVANSAAHGLGRPIRSVQQAAVVLGLRVIRNLAISHAVRASTSVQDTGAFDAQQFWEDSLRRAIAGMVIARRAGFQDPAEAFTVGLIQDLGCLAMALSFPQQAEALQAATRLPGGRRIEEERRLTATTHPEVFVTIGSDWGLPEEMVAVIASHHGKEQLADRRAERVRSIASVADAVADVVQTGGDRESIVLATNMLSDLPSREPLEFETLLEEVVEGMKTASADMQIEIGEQPSVQELMSQAGKVMLSINASYEETTRQLQEANERLEEANQLLQEALREKQEIARQLRASNETLSRLAATDVLTGVSNRRAFVQVLQQRLAEAADSKEPLSLIMLDIDHFKRINDTFGHAAGDEVLKVVCQRISKMLRDCDLIGRLGGEEFAVLLVGANASLGQRVAERLRVVISSEPVVSREGTRIAVASSFGGVTVEGDPLPTSDDLFVSVDRALYHSKENGRNRVSWVR